MNRLKAAIALLPLLAFQSLCACECGKPHKEGASFQAASSLEQQTPNVPVNDKCPKKKRR